MIDLKYLHLKKWLKKLDFGGLSVICSFDPLIFHIQRFIFVAFCIGFEVFKSFFFSTIYPNPKVIHSVRRFISFDGSCSFMALIFCSPPEYLLA